MFDDMNVQIRLDQFSSKQDGKNITSLFHFDKHKLQNRQ